MYCQIFFFFFFHFCLVSSLFTLYTELFLDRSWPSMCLEFFSIIIVGANDVDLCSKVLVVLGWLGSSRKDAQDVNITGPSSMKNEEVMGPRQQVKPTALHSKTPTAKSAKCKDNASSATDKQSTNSVIKVQNRYGLLSDNES